MRHNRLMSFVCVLALATVCAPVAAQDNPMDVFKPLLGTWSTRAVHKPSQNVKVATPSEGEVTAKMILNDRFIRYEGYASTPGNNRLDYQAIMTYDSKKRIYRRWIFRSDGVTAESAGIWDADKMTMTWTAIGLPEGISFTGTTKITNEGFEETIYGKRGIDVVLMDITTVAQKKR